jgi:hypothetical protein
MIASLPANAIPPEYELWFNGEMHAGAENVVEPAGERTAPAQLIALLLPEYPYCTKAVPSGAMPTASGQLPALPVVTCRPGAAVQLPLVLGRSAAHMSMVPPVMYW